MELPLPQQTYQSRSKPFSSERLLNMLLEKGGEASSKYMLIGTPGLKEIYDFGGDEPVLGMIYLRNFLVYATGKGIYVIYQIPGTNTVSVVVSKLWSEMSSLLGRASNPNLPIKMCCNGDTVMMLHPNDKTLFFVDLFGNEELNPTSWNIAMVEVPNQEARYISVDYISGVFVSICQIGSASYIQYTDVLGRTMRHAFQLDTALTNLTALASNMRELWCFGANSIEVVAPTGDADENFFAHVPGAYTNKGCVCKNSIAVYETVFFFYGSNGNIYAAENYTSLKQISTPALLDMIKSWGSLDTQAEKDSVVGQIYTQAGHTFYMLKFKKFGKTLLYDITTQSWLERESGNGEEWEGNYVIRRPNGDMIVSGAKEDKLYVMDSSIYTDNGKPICREFVFATIKTEAKKRIFFYSLTLDVDVGLGPDDTVMLSWSDDGGYTWTGERMLRLGNYGQYKKKIQFRRLGSSSLRTYKVRFSTASMVNVLSASVEMEEGLV